MSSYHGRTSTWTLHFVGCGPSAGLASFPVSTASVFFPTCKKKNLAVETGNEAMQGGVGGQMSGAPRVDPTLALHIAARSVSKMEQCLHQKMEQCLHQKA